jgi:hypothetical protein
MILLGDGCDDNSADQDHCCLEEAAVSDSSIEVEDSVTTNGHGHDGGGDGNSQGPTEQLGVAGVVDGEGMDAAFMDAMMERMVRVSWSYGVAS